MSNTTDPTIQQQANQFWQAFVKTFELNALSPKWQAEDLHGLIEQINDFKAETIQEEWAEDIVLEIMANSESLELVLSANGNHAAFPYIRVLQKAAPSIPYLKVIAFRSPIRHPDFEFNMNGIKVGMGDIKPQVLVNNGFIDLRIGFPTEITEENLEQYQQISYILTDHILGEWDSIAKVASVEACEIADLDPAEGTIYAVSELHAAITSIWENTLGFLGVYPSGEMRYAVGQAHSRTADPEGEPDIMISLNQSAKELVGHPDYMQTISIESGLANFEVITNLEDSLMDLWLLDSKETLSDYQGGIFAYRLSLLSEGILEQRFYVRSTERTLAYIHSYLEHHLGAEHGCVVECDADPAWMNYRMLG